MRTTTEIFGDELGAAVKDFGGFKEEGEIRTMCEEDWASGFWFLVGTWALCRYWSRMLVLQIITSDNTFVSSMI